MKTKHTRKTNGFLCQIHNTVMAALFLLALLPVSAFAQFETLPPSATVTAGSNVTFTTTLGDTPAAPVRWRVSTNNGASWSLITDDGNYSGSTTGTLTITAVPASFNGYQYQMRITFSLDLVFYSDPATLTVTSGIPPTITSPSVFYGDVGISFNANLTATGTTPITWDISPGYGILPPGLSLNPSTGVISGTPTTAGSFTFLVYATNIVSVDRLYVTIHVNPATTLPYIVSHPANNSIWEGGNASLSVAATNCTGTFSYQWQYRTNAGVTWSNVINSGVYSGASTSNLLLNNVPVSYNGYLYRCIVTCSATPDFPLESNEATLTVMVAPTPPVIIKHPEHNSIVAGEGASFTVEATNCAGTFSYQWQYRTGANASWFNVTNTTIYSGATTPTLTLSSRVTTQYDGYQYRSRVTCSSMPGNPIYSNAGTLNISTKVPVITVAPPAEPLCTALDYLSVPFSKIDNVHPMKYSLRFSDEAKAEGFKDTSFDNLPADLTFKIDVPKDARSQSYSAVIVITCEGIDDYKDEYPFTFSVINNGVYIMNQPPAFLGLCNGASIAMVVDIAGNTNSYQWYRNDQPISGARNKEYVTETAGNCYVEISGVCGIIKSEVTVVTPRSSITSDINVRVKWGNVLYVENAADKYERYQWYHNGTAVNGATIIYLPVREGLLGEYTVRCFKPDGSFDETCPVMFDVLTRSSVTAVFPTFLKTDDVLNINISDADIVPNATIEIYSLLGIKVYSTQITTSVATIQPDFRQKGNYFVLIKLSSGEVITEKIVVQ